MDNLTRRALWNAACVAAELGPGESIDHDDLIDALRRPLLEPDSMPSDADIHHAYRFHVLRGGIKNAEDVATYEQAAELAGTTLPAVCQAAYRGQLEKRTTYWLGRERSGVTLRSLAEWRRWSLEQFEAAANRLREAK